MKVTVFCSDKNHPVWSHLADWCRYNKYQLVNDKSQLGGGEFLFLVSCTEIIGPERLLYENTLVIHESAVPEGRGWSPLAWQVLGGENDITVSLLEAADSVDAGAVWLQSVLKLEGHELSDEINEKLVRIKIDLMQQAIDGVVTPRQQAGQATYYTKRTPQDSRLDPHKTLAEQFNLLRICEPRFPAFFDYRGHRYEVSIKKA